MDQSEQTKKGERALREEAVLAFWKERDIFKKTLEKKSPHGEFVFYEGPPTANAKPALHHLEARVFKDAIPRYKTMRGYHVRRKAGWDTHGLPVELQIEKELGFKSKKDIEAYGIAAFNKKCKESVHTYIDLWRTFTERIGYWVDFKAAYYTYDPQYMESLWSIIAEVHDRGLLYKDYKVVPWCPRCGTGLSSHELAQGYQDDKDLSVTAKFKVKGQDNTYLLAWTTTPWTLPGNVALAVGKDIEYVEVEYPLSSLMKAFDQKEQTEQSEIASANVTRFILAKDRLDVVFDNSPTVKVIKHLKGSDLVGLEYEPLYPYLATLDRGDEKFKNAYKVYAADFVTTDEGTGIVHTAVMYGQDDFELGTKVGLPKYHLVDEAGHFINGTDFLEGRFVKDEDVAVDIIKDLAHRGLLFKKEKYEHPYPHCWRCKTPLIYYARDSWYIQMSKLREDLINANDTINWEPAHIKEGRFGEWLREVKDWAISRERYWGTPLPIWTNDAGEKLIVDSIDTLKHYTRKSGNTYIAIRHGEAEHNVKNIWSCTPGSVDALTEKGKKQIASVAKKLNGKVDLIIASPFQRGQQTARIIADAIGIDPNAIITDPRIGEWNIGSEFDLTPMDDYFKVRNKAADRYHFTTADGESYADVFVRNGLFLYDLEKTYQNKRILIVTHGGSARAMELVARGFAYDTLFETTREYRDFANAEVREIHFVPLPHNGDFELDLHRPYIDDVVLEKDGTQYKRVKEVIDVWFDSGSMPFAQDHYPFENKQWIEKKGYPADFISEAIDQTRGWFYTLLAVGVLMKRGTPYKNVICLGHLLDAQGKKMSKSIGNIVEPFEQIEKFGVDAVRFWMYSVNQPGESKNYDEKSIVEINNKVFNLLGNVLSFYELYRDKKIESKKWKAKKASHVLDEWIVARLNQLTAIVGESMDAFDLFRPTRAIREFIDDLSTWYLRRSRDRIKDGDSDAKQTLYFVLKTMAKVLAPFAPFTAEDMWQKLRVDTNEESVHLTEWPKLKKLDTDTEEILNEMKRVRTVVAQGNAERKKLNIPTRQPLSSVMAAPSPSPEAAQFNELIIQELNTENFIPTIGLDTKVRFDEVITPELKLKGDYRELIRAVQDLRKTSGLTPSDVVTIIIDPEAQQLLSQFIDDFKKTVLAKNVTFAQNDGQEIKLGDALFRVTIEK
ncbi:MAG TPA: class I tRNA ligase family protein [Candidatus Paceibacterota bacterium]|nr:class I tRNA ligase family protein [Candidatus Paceibacterota bacterium]